MTARRPGPIPVYVSDAQLGAHDQLLRVVADADPADVPCLAMPDPAWTSEDPDDQQLVARLCGRCPTAVMAACRSYTLEHEEPVGVYGGLTVAERRRIRRERAA